MQCCLHTSISGVTVAAATAPPLNAGLAIDDHSVQVTLFAPHSTNVSVVETFVVSSIPDGGSAITRRVDLPAAACPSSNVVALPCVPHLSPPACTSPSVTPLSLCSPALPLLVCIHVTCHPICSPLFFHLARPRWVPYYYVYISLFLYLCISALCARSLCVCVCVCV